METGGQLYESTHRFWWHFRESNLSNCIFHSDVHPYASDSIRFHHSCIRNLREVFVLTRVLLVAPLQEIVIHDIPIHDNSDVKQVQKFIKNKEVEYGEITRILFSLGTVRVMKDLEEIQIPLRSLPRGEH